MQNFFFNLAFKIHSVHFYKYFELLLNELHLNLFILRQIYSSLKILICE